MGFQKLSARHRFVLHCVCLIRIENFARQVLSSDRFVFGSGQASSGLDVIVTSSNSGLPGQEGLDRIAKDIQQFVKGGGAAVQQEAAEGDGVPEDSEEDGVSSIMSSTEQQAVQGRPARARQAIVWGEDHNSAGDQLGLNFMANTELMYPSDTIVWQAVMIKLLSPLLTWKDRQEVAYRSGLPEVFSEGRGKLSTCPEVESNPGPR